MGWIECHGGDHSKQSIFFKPRFLMLLPTGCIMVTARKMGRIWPSVNPCQILSRTPKRYRYAACEGVVPDNSGCAGFLQVCLQTCAASTSHCLLPNPCAGNAQLPAGRCTCHPGPGHEMPRPAGHGLTDAPRSLQSSPGYGPDKE